MFRVLAALAALLPTTALAQIEHDAQFWFNGTVMGPIKDELVYFLEVQPRIGDDLQRLDQLLLRGAMGYKITPQLTLHQGYAHVVLPVSGGRDRSEERSFQQLLWVVPGLRRGELSFRTRTEQRWRSDGDDMQFRVRQMIRYEYPLSGRKKPVNALGSIEGFAALNKPDWRPRAGFDQVRTFAGVEIPLQGKSTVEAGYLNQLIDERGGRARMNHVASLSLFVRP